MKTSIKAVLFDKDGTLLDFDAAWGPAYEVAALFAADGDPGRAQAFLEQTGMDPDTRKSGAGSLLAAGNSAEIAIAWIEAGAAFDPDVLTAELDRIFIARMHDAPPLPGTLETLEVLSRAGYLLGVASSDSEAAIRTFLKGARLAKHFAFVTGYDSGFGPKPEPGMVHAFAKALGLAPPEIAVIGDNTHDLEMARSAGAGLAIGVLSGTSRREDLEPLADMILDSVKDLSGVIVASGETLVEVPAVD